MDGSHYTNLKIEIPSLNRLQSLLWRDAYAKVMMMNQASIPLYLFEDQMATQSYSICSEKAISSVFMFSSKALLLPGREMRTSFQFHNLEQHFERNHNICSKICLCSTCSNNFKHFSSNHLANLTLGTSTHFSTRAAKANINNVNKPYQTPQTTQYCNVPACDSTPTRRIRNAWIFNPNSMMQNSWIR